MFSVVIPLYNKEDYIQKAIDSVLQQSHEDLELIVVNDGSTDNSLEIVQEFKDSRIKIIDQSNFGVSIARNNGVKAARYDHIAFLDADDWWDLHYLQEMQQLIHKYPDAGLWAAKYFKVKFGRETEARVGLEKGFKQGYIDYFKVYSTTMWMPITSSFIIPKEIFKELTGYKANIKIGEDFDLWVRIALKYKIAYLNKVLVYYNQDVDANNRAVGGGRIWKPENHYIFQLEYLKKEEKINPSLKHLLDKLRLRALLRYHLAGVHRKETKRILAEIDFSAQPFSWHLKYHIPLSMLKLWYSLKKAGSALKKGVYNTK
jgi:glycosyltransferase involved in cell wall biosynthesis